MSQTAADILIETWISTGRKAGVQGARDEMANLDRMWPLEAPLAHPYAPIDFAIAERRRTLTLARRDRPAAALPLGRRTWVIAEGHIPGGSKGSAPSPASHETACILNPNDETALIELTLYFADRDPIGPYRISVPPCRTYHLRFDSLEHPAPVPRDTDYASVFRASLPVVVQPTRLDVQGLSHTPTTIAWGE